MDRHTAARRRFLIAALASWAGAAVALEAPAGPALLSVVGDIRSRNAGEGFDFDLDMLNALPRHGFTTTTPWYPRPHTFSGVLLRDLLAAVGAQGTTIRAVALNDYRVDIPVEDAARHDVLVAWLLDGKPIAVREKGPLVLMYPFDDQPQLRNAVHYSRAAWQLRRLELR